MSFEHLEISNPKRESQRQVGRASWYPYYAGFSVGFAQTIISSAQLDSSSSVIDPWNGSGTTTAAAAGLGHDAYGFDLNPVMVLVARARMLSKREKTSLLPLAQAIVSSACHVVDRAEDDEPLATWFVPQSAAYIRSIERSLRTYLLPDTVAAKVIGDAELTSFSDLAAFFYVALFCSVRSLLRSFGATNPTWIRRPTDLKRRLRTNQREISICFLVQVEKMAAAIDADRLNKDSETHIRMASSHALPVADQSIDFILSSPPYCTRIDYAMATLPELALLGYRGDREFSALRRRLIGTATVPEIAPNAKREWGMICNSFLERVATHKSKASASYYLKSHLQYFDSVYGSLSEISRILRTNGKCVLVVQDSHYKNVRNDLPGIVSEMAESNELGLKRRVDFTHQRTMAQVNRRVRQYRRNVAAIESVMCFLKS